MAPDQIASRTTAGAAWLGALRGPRLTTSADSTTSRPHATWFEYTFGALAALMFQGAIFPLLRPHDPNVAGTAAALAEGDPIARSVQGLVLVVLLSLTIIRWKWVGPVLSRAKPLILIVVFVMSSILWSVGPFLTFRRALSLMDCFLFGYYAYAVYGPRNTIRLIATVGVVAAIACLAVAIVAPHVAFETRISSDKGALIGVYSQKNELSVNVLIGFCACMYLGLIASDRSRYDRLLTWAIPIFIVVLALSHGVTSMVAATFITFATIVFFAGIRSRLMLIALYAVGALGLVIVIATIVDPKFVFGLIGKDSSLTGRWPLWVACVGAIKERPFFGYGYAAFWQPGVVQAEYVWETAKFAAASAHNGFLQLALDIGFVGMSFYLYLIFRLVQLTIRAIRVGEVSEAKWLALFLIAMLIENLDEGTLAWPDLMASQVAFGAALTETWWHAHMVRMAKERVAVHVRTWSDMFAGQTTRSTLSPPWTS